jgi:hypothetical protein
MNRWKPRIATAAIGALLGLAALIEYKAMADPSSEPPSRTVDQRVAELEAKVKILELRLHVVEATLKRAPRSGAPPAARP